MDILKTVTTVFGILIAMEAILWMLIYSENLRQHCESHTFPRIDTCEDYARYQEREKERSLAFDISQREDTKRFWLRCLVVNGVVSIVVAVGMLLS